jgi:hypothetical protein
MLAQPPRNKAHIAPAEARAETGRRVMYCFQGCVGRVKFSESIQRAYPRPNALSDKAAMAALGRKQP